MATYLILGQFQREGLAWLATASKPEDAEEDPTAVFKDLADDPDIGVTFGRTWFTTGVYDIVVEIDADSLGRAMGYAVALADIGEMKTFMLAAEPDLTAVVRRARKAHLKHGHLKHGSARVG